MDKPQIVEMGPVLLAGLSFFGDPFAYHLGWETENEIGRLWSRFYQLLEQQPAFKQAAQEADLMYEMHLMHPQSAVYGNYEVFIGFPVSQADQLPVHFLIKRAPAKRYLQYLVSGQAIIEDCEHLPISEDLRGLGLQRDPSYHFVGYDERFLGMQRLDESTVLVLIPILES